MSTFTKRVNASSDDGTNNNGWDPSWGYTSNSLLTGKSGFPTNQDWTMAVRFTSVTIPNGSTINSAKITFQASSGDSNTVYTKIYGIDEDNTSTFTSNPTGRTKTTANNDWDQGSISSGNNYDTSSLTSIVQEIVNRGGWSSGNAMGFIIANDGTGNGISHYFDSYDGDSSNAPLLTINYTGPATTTSTTTTSTSSTTTSTTTTSTSTTLPPPVTEDYGIRISKPGKDVVDSVSPNDFYLDSRYPLLKVHSYGTFWHYTNGSSATIYHNLGYKPFVLVFSKLLDYNYSTFAKVLTSKYYQHDWHIEGASATWEGTTKIYDDRIVIKVSQTDADVEPPFTTRVEGFYYIFKDEV